ncbi:MAG TPA: cysteine synthase family protein [Fimbriimonadaceae bacterium]|nr:cysteine synthase family protein [Fimbriimonadaceae bacterium]
MSSRTPIVEIDGVYAKLECVNPTGSIKDRVAEFILDESERRGLLCPGMTIVEATSGNTGIALAKYGRERGYAVTIVMPENMTEERKALIRGFGANLVLCGEGDFAGAVAIRDEMAAQPGYFNPDQFSNELNVECHYRTTGQEILDQVPGPIEAFVAGVGTGGSLIGVAKALRERYPQVRVVAVEPTEAAVMSGRETSPHRIFGIGDGFIPPIAQNAEGGLHDLIDEVAVVSSDEAIETASALRGRGYCVGISSGANYLAAKQLGASLGTVVTVFADGYVKYQSHGLRCADEPCCPHAEACKR